ncbi:pilus assembly protein CpaF [Micromonospora globispora]|uniref:Pilus assembly protein CpaF n=1 Tax=Micromonospora globispora TaxID=1450148 RepID=A0A317KEL6_9ACTN|nr:CpaF family protein [Micromonospora globispora]PWU51972.1 pilus assembly protein CpaF [Micromonospora globispora]
MSLSDRLAQRYPAGGDSGRTTRTSGSITRTSGPITGPTVGTSTSALRLRIHRELLDILGPQLYDNRTPDSVLEKKVRDTINEVLARSDSPLAVTDSARISAELLDEILGHGPVEPLLRDPDVTEIMVNGPDQIFVERFGRIHQVDASFVDEQHLRRVIDRIVSRVGRRVDESSPMVDARLPDGSRVNVVLPPVALDGSMLTIRKFARDAFTTEDLIGFGTFTPEVAQFLYACVRARLDIVISGGTGSGKTTTLNVLSSFLPPDERIVTIEDAAELQLRQNHVLRLESRPPNIEGRGEISVRDLVRNALRMRPDRIVIGEVRDGAALDLLQAMNTGHNGSLTTVHANSPRDSVARLETMSLMAGLELPVRAIREQIASAVDLVVHQSRLRDGSRRVTHVTEVLGMEGDVVTMQDLFVFDHRAGHDEHGRHLGTLRWTGLRPRLLDTLADAGVPVPVGLFEGRPW